jgi:hypothetical protein
MYGTCLTQNGNEDSEGDLKDVILLDTGSTIGATIANPDLITNLKATSSPLQMATNAGTKTLNLKGDVIGFGKAWYDPDFMANIFGFAKMAEKHRITYDSNIEDAFLVHTEDGDVLKFERTLEGLYAYRPPKDFLDSVAQTKIKPARKQNFVSTVKENLEGFTKREVDDAMLARKLYHTSGCPTVDNLRMMIRMNQIENCPVTITDVTNATKIWGPDLGALKGKTTRRTPSRVRQDEIDIPPEPKARFDDVILCVDLMYAQGIPILSTIDKTIRFRGVVPMKGKKAKQMYEALDVVLRQYNKAGITIKEIRCDQEFRPLFEHLANDMDIRLNCCTTNEHIPEAERNNRTIGERMLCIHHGFPRSSWYPNRSLQKAPSLEGRL